ncbi:MAG: sporulation protein YabP [Clostridia bacterium]|nr:sporulation protein YabP [Clostridia bacterium]
MNESKHFLSLTDRTRLDLEGVRSVISFREEATELETALGTLQITGEGLHMEKLDLDDGKVILTGRIDSLYYPGEPDENRKGIFRRLFS